MFRKALEKHKFELPFARTVHTYTQVCVSACVFVCVCCVCVFVCICVYVCARVYTHMQIRIEKYKGQIQKIMSTRMIEIQKENTTHNLQNKRNWYVSLNYSAGYTVLMHGMGNSLLN